MPNHLCTYEWVKDEEKILAECKAKGKWTTMAGGENAMGYQL